MKAVILGALVFIIAGCSELKRSNPTDPAAGNYVGLHYVGELGQFVNLTDMEIAQSSGQAYIFGTDDAQKITVKYDLNGTYIKYWETQDLPKGICADSASNIYIVDVANYIEIYTADGVTLGQFHFATGTGGGKIACDADYLYATTASPPKIYKYVLNTVATPNPTPVASWGVEGICDGCYSVISAVETDMAGNLIIADSGLNRITITDSAGNFIKKIELVDALQGLSVSGGSIYVPGINGIKQYDYNGTLLKTYADYGEGKGKVTAVAPMVIYDKQIFIGDVVSIKVFKP